MTIEQKQCLLRYLGYYKDDIDGIWGTNSKKATEQFKANYGQEATDSNLLKAVNGTLKPVDWWNNIKYFKKSEFKCKCGGKYCNGYPVDIQRELVEVADRVRKHFGAPATVSSGVRCEKHNSNVGGVSGSRHKLGKAMDFCVKGKTANEVLAYVKNQPEIRYAYAIDSRYVHMDIQ